MTFSDRQSLYWFEFASIIRRAAKSPSTLKFCGPTKLQPKMITIVDYSLLRRKKQYMSTAAGRVEDELRDAQVCNCGWIKGEIPLKNFQDPPGVYHRGALETIRVLDNQKLIYRTKEVVALLQMWARYRRGDYSRIALDIELDDNDE